MTTEMTKLDLFAEHKAEYAAKAKPTLVEVSPAVYLAIDGVGAPESEAYSEAIGALYGMAFTLKMRRKFAGLGDYAIGKMECLYPQAELPSDRAQWRWRLLMRTPEFITQAELSEAAALQKDKGKSPLVDEVKLVRLEEGLCAQMMHVGPYDNVCQTITALHELAAAKGCAFAGAHHEIYLNDPRRMPPEKLKTIVRQPLKKL